GAAVDLQGDVARGGRPDGQRRPAVAEHRPEVRLGGAGGVEVVEHAGELHAGGGEHGSGGGALGGDDLAAQGRAHPVPVARVDGPGGAVLQVREAGLLGVGEGRPRQAQPAGVAGAERAVLDRDGAGGRGEELGGGGGVGAVPDEGVPVDPDRLGGGEVVGGRGAPGLRQQVLLLPAYQPHLVPVVLEVQRQVGRHVLLVALVDYVAEPGGTLGERHLEDRAIGVNLHRLQGARPVGGIGGTGPRVQAPAVVVAVGAVVVQDGLGGVLGRVLGPFGGDGLLALLDPDLAGAGEVDRAVGVDVLGAVLVDDDEAQVGGARLQLDVREGAVGVAAGEGVAVGPLGGLALGEVAPGVQAPVVVVAVGPLVVDDRVVAGGGGGRRLHRRGAGGGDGEGARGTAGGVGHDGLVAQGGTGGDVLADGVGDLVRGVVGGAEDAPLPVARLGGEDDPVELSALDVGGQLDGAGGARLGGLQGEGGLRGRRAEASGRLADDRRARGDGDGDLPVGVAAHGGVGAVEALERRPGGVGREGGLLRLVGVVEGDDVLGGVLAGGGAGDGVDAGAVGGVAFLLDAVGQGGVRLAELREGADLPVERRAGVVGVLGVGAVGADQVVVEVVGGAGGEEGLAGVLVA